jgi:glycosyltransferase involved in cell wall biosynthesis
LVRDAINGLIVEPESAEALASALALLMGNDVVRKAFAANTREVLTRFSPESALEKWDALLENVVGCQRL